MGKSEARVVLISSFLSSTGGQGYKQKRFNNQAEGQDSPLAVLCDYNNKRASHRTSSNRKYELALPCNLKGFPCSSVGKESACSVRDPSLNPGTGRSPGEGIGYPLQYSWASLWLSW